MLQHIKSLFAIPTAAAPTQIRLSDVNAPTTNQQRILQAVEQCYRVAERCLQRQFPRPEVSFKLSGKSAGTAHLQLQKLRFNAVLLEENIDTFIGQVVPHEICHLLAYTLYGRVKPHGHEWQNLMTTLFNVTPSVTHNLNIDSVVGRTFDYYCQCGTVSLTIRRHNKVLRNQTQYRCRRCKQTLSQVEPN